MQNSSSENFIPFYIKYFVILASIVLTSYVLIIARPVFNPLLAAFFIALLLKPFSAKLEKMRMPRAVSTLLSLLLILLIITCLSTFFSSQVRNITSDMNSVASSFNIWFDKLQQWTSDKFGIAPRDQVTYLKGSLNALLRNSASFFQNTLSATAEFFSIFLLFIIALFFFLYYRTFLVSFLYKLFREENHPRLESTIGKIEAVVRKYIWGLFLVIITMATLNVIGLLVLGIKHAVFFGVLAAMLTIIPYIGIIIGSLLPILFALITTDSLWYPFGVLILFVIVQFLEGNFITPNIIGTQVSINPFAAVLGLFIGGIMFGLLGVVFAIPLLAIIKVICDEVHSLTPIGYLIGNPPASGFKCKLSKIFRTKFKK